jgi:hypothetical protein
LERHGQRAVAVRERFERLLARPAMIEVRDDGGLFGIGRVAVEKLAQLDGTRALA